VTAVSGMCVMIIIITAIVMIDLFLCQTGSDNLVGLNKNIEFHFTFRILTKFIKELQVE
jgi:hypothetical protein